MKVLKINSGKWAEIITWLIVVGRKKVLSLSIIFISLIFYSFSDKPAYQIFNKNGKKSSFHQLIKQLESADVVLLGELHNNPISHWVELSVLKTLPSDKVIAGGEMFESEDQDALNKFLNGNTNLEELEKGVDLWSNFSTDYLPLLEYSREHNIPFIATNAPRKFARLVAKKGISALDSLSDREKKWLAPLPFKIDMNLPGYQNMLKESIHGESMWNNYFMAEAQALKDATMAHFIYSNFKPGSIFLHVNGAYHSNNFEGIYWYLKKSNPSLKIVTITTVEQEHIEKLDKSNLNKADFIIAVPEDMTKTY